MRRYHETHPGTVATVRVVLPINVVVCPCGLHYMARGQRIHRAYCERLRTRDAL